MLHLSLFLFFAGLAVFLFNINHTVFKVTISWVGFCTGMYVCITLMPMLRHDSPYYAPLSSLAWYLYTGTGFTLFRILFWIADRCHLRSISLRAYNLRTTYWERTFRSINKEFERAALRASSEIDGHALMWTYESLDEDHELEQFFAGIPGFCSSKVVDNPQSSLDSLRSLAVASALNGFLKRTWSSNLVSETIKIRRFVICVRAIDAAHLSHAAGDFYQNFLPQLALLQSVELGHYLISSDNSNDNRKSMLFSQGIIAYIIANAPQRDERWFSLTMRHLGISEHVLRSYLDHGGSVILANLVDFTHQFFRNFLEADWDDFPLSYILSLLGAHYSVQNALPGLQNEFCALWNEIFLQSGDTDHPALLYVLREIHHIYVTFHQDSSTLYDHYQLCSVPSHRTESVDDGRTAETARALITTSPALHHHGTGLPAFSPVTEYDPYDPPPSPASSLDHLTSHSVPRNVVPDNVTPLISISSFHPAPENNRVSDSTAADPIQGTTDLSAISSMVNSGFRSMSPTRNMTAATPSSVPETLPSPNPLPAISPDSAAQHISGDLTVNKSGRPPDDGSISYPSSTPNFHPMRPEDGDPSEDPGLSI